MVEGAAEVFEIAPIGDSFDELGMFLGAWNFIVVIREPVERLGKFSIFFLTSVRIVPCAWILKQPGFSCFCVFEGDADDVPVSTVCNPVGGKILNDPMNWPSS